MRIRFWLHINIFYYRLKIGKKKCDDISDSTQIIGVGSENDGYFFGYNTSDFGVLRRTNGKTHIEKFNVPGPFGASTDITFTLNNVATPLVNISTASDARVAWQIANGGTTSVNYGDVGNGWRAVFSGNDVYFIALTAGYRSRGSYSATAALTNSTLLEGQVATDYWTPQTNWNVDKADGRSIMPIIDPTKGNVYRITYQCLGYGMINYFIENPLTGLFQLIHQNRYDNSETQTSITNPKHKLFVKIKKSAGTGLIKMKILSMCALLSGNFNDLFAIRNSASFSLDDFSSLESYIIFSLRNKLVVNKLVVNNRVNTFKVILDSISITNSKQKIITIVLYKNAAFDASITWTDYPNSTLVQVYDPADSAIEPYINGTGFQLIGFIIVEDTSQPFVDLSKYKLSFFPGETLSCVGKFATSGGDKVNVTLNWVEDI